MTAPRIAKSGPFSLKSPSGAEPGDLAERHDGENGRKHREDHLRHEKNSASQAWMKSVIARRSADPPGLSRRVTNDWCTTLARSRQLRVPTPPPSRKTRAAYWA